ncbi:MAG: NYN domain-containing protein [Pseudomonadota bacterium]
MLSAVFVDYDNIYLSLRRKNEDAARRFAKDAGRWIAALQSGQLIRPSIPGETQAPRRLVMNRCYGNPIPRKNPNENSTDMNSFPFVRNHFLRTGFEIIDCPPLTAQLKNSSDIKMVMDLRDFLTHETYFNEFIILSSDADFTPVLHRLRAHDRRTVIFSNDNAAAAYTALADGAVHESDLIKFLMEGEPIEESDEAAIVDQSEARGEIVKEVVKLVREAPAPVPIEALAQRATQALGTGKTSGSNWGGVGTFLELLKADLPSDIRLTDTAPYYACDMKRVTQQIPRPEIAQSAPAEAITPPPAKASPEPLKPQTTTPQPAPEPVGQSQAASGAGPTADHSAELQRSVSRILDASQVPAISRPDYRVIFEELAAEISENQLQGVQTIARVVERLKARNVALRTEDARFILDVVSETDPWFEKDISANIFAGRFRNFVVTRCRSQGLSLSSQELDLIEMWFAGSAPEPERPDASRLIGLPATAPSPQQPSPQPSTGSDTVSTDPTYKGPGALDDMPRFVRAQSRT